MEDSQINHLKKKKKKFEWKVCKPGDPPHVRNSLKEEHETVAV